MQTQGHTCLSRVAGLLEEGGLAMASEPCDGACTQTTLLQCQWWLDQRLSSLSISEWLDVTAECPDDVCVAFNAATDSHSFQEG